MGLRSRTRRFSPLRRVAKVARGSKSNRRNGTPKGASKSIVSPKREQFRIVRGPEVVRRNAGSKRRF